MFSWINIALIYVFLFFFEYVAGSASTLINYDISSLHFTMYKYPKRPQPTYAQVKNYE